LKPFTNTSSPLVNNVTEHVHPEVLYRFQSKLPTLLIAPFPGPDYPLRQHGGI
jgi:hypothetical protein